MDPRPPSFQDPAVGLAAARVVVEALAEDLGAGDVTTRSTVPAETRAVARIVAKAPVRVCGLPVWELALRHLGAGADTRVEGVAAEGAELSPGEVLARAEGPARLLLGAERVVMNLVCHLSGIASLAARYVAAAGDLRVLDTRKTTPGLRALEKYAARTGGAANHRLGLDGGVLIKENHIAAAGSVETAVAGARRLAPHSLRIQCEVRTPEEAARAVAAGAEALLLDNMDTETIADCARRFGERVFLEASGNMTPERVRELAPLAALGLHAVSAGSITHSRPYADLSMLLTVEEG